LKAFERLKGRLQTNHTASDRYLLCKILLRGPAKAQLLQMDRSKSNQTKNCEKSWWRDWIIRLLRRIDAQKREQ